MAMLDLALGAAVLALAVWMLRVRSDVAAVRGCVALGLLLALAWVRLSAMDVALSQGAIGAGANGVMLLLAAIRGCAGSDASSPSRAQEWVVGALCSIISAALAWAMLSLPEPQPSLGGISALGVTNPVNEVLMAFRALNTLLVGMVVVLAVIALWSMAPDAAWGGVAGLWPLPAFASPWLRWTLVAGPLAFIVVGLLGFPLAGDFLAYPPALAKPLILLIGAAMTLSVAAAFALLMAGPPEGGA